MYIFLRTGASSAPNFAVSEIQPSSPVCFQPSNCWRSCTEVSSPHCRLSRRIPMLLTPKPESKDSQSGPSNTLFLYHCQRPHLPCPTVVFRKRVCVCSAYRTQPCVSVSCSFPHAAQLSTYCAYLGTSLPPNTLISNTLACITKAIFYTFSGQ